MSERTCKSCGAPMQDGQQWCLTCGAGQPGSLSKAQGWRAGAAALALAAFLVIGASVAAYAALTKPQAKHPKTLAQRPLVPGTTMPTVPGTVTPTPTTPGATPAPGTPTTIKTTPPKIPLQTPTPKSSEPSDSALFPSLIKASKGSKGSSGSSGKSPEGSGSGSGSEAGSGSGSESGQGGSGSGAEAAIEGAEPILLDTNAASTYNPYAYPPTLFGDPAAAIDGEPSTAWTATVDPAKAPNMAEGLVLDLRTPQKLSGAKVKTTTTGTVIEMYGANGHALPSSITDPAWKRLSGAKTLKKKSSALKLKAAGKPYRYIVLWLVKAPVGASVVAIHELEIFS